MELARTKSTGKAIVYVGAGASVPAGFDTWSGLLKKLIDELPDDEFTPDPCTGNKTSGSDADKPEPPHASPSTPKATALRLLNHQQYLLLAEFLHNNLGQRLHGILNRILDKTAVPTSIHYALTRIPFTMAMTTNYDSLLERAYATTLHRPYINPLTWKDPFPLLFATQLGGFRIVKTHGDLSDPLSVVLTLSHYRDQLYKHNRFREILKLLLLTRTFVFVCTSLQDPDLLSLLDESVSGYRDRFGPHFVIMPHDEVYCGLAHHLDGAYNIKVISYKHEQIDFGDRLLDFEAPDSSASQASATRLPFTRERALVHTLTCLGGEVAALTRMQSDFSDATPFCRDAAMRTLLGDVVSVTGSFRADIFLVDDHATRRLQLAYTFNPGDMKPRVIAEPRSIISSAYYLSPFRKSPTQFDNGIYVEDVSLFRHQRAFEPISDRRSRCKEISRETVEEWERHEILHRLVPYGELRYVNGHTATQSQYACPIFSHGERVGVLSVESTQTHAYSKAHRDAADAYAERAGRIYTHAEELRQRSSEIVPSAEKGPNAYAEGIAQQLRRHPLLNSIEFKAIVYRVNHVAGSLEGKSPDGKEEFRFRFEDPEKADSFAWRVYHGEAAYYVPNAREAVERDSGRGLRPLFYRKYFEKLEIGGSVYGLPLSIDGVGHVW
jgi:hypothetical protein